MSLPYRPPLAQPLLWNIPEVDLYFSPWIWAGQGWAAGLQEKQRETEAVAEPPALSDWVSHPRMLRSASQA